MGTHPQANSCRVDRREMGVAGVVVGDLHQNRQD